ncbi:MAG: hypothetical protein ACYC6C_13550 [Coriobacteriia bacterium]
MSDAVDDITDFQHRGAAMNPEQLWQDYVAHTGFSVSAELAPHFKRVFLDGVEWRREFPESPISETGGQ